MAAEMVQADDGKWWVNDTEDPSVNLPIVELLDKDGETTTDEDKAFGGVFQWPDGTFGIFAVPENIDPLHLNKDQL